MNELDLTKILKNCPRGTEFYSSLFEKVIFDSISYGRIIIECVKLHRLVVFNQAGKYLMEESENNSTCFSSECLLFPSKEQRDWSKFTAPWFKKDKFNLKTLQSFDKILVRDNANGKWVCTLFSHINNDTCFVCQASDSAYVYGIPYNDETKHLVGTENEAPEFYRYWEN